MSLRLGVVLQSILAGRAPARLFDKVNAASCGFLCDPPSFARTRVRAGAD